MSLNSALQIGRSAIVASQAGIQVTGNNMANAATEGYHRRSVHMSPVRGELVGPAQLVGRGVQLSEVRREIDTALQSRYRDALSEENAVGIDARFLTAVETLQNELTDNDLSSLLSEFFNSFSELANNPEDDAVRSIVVQQGVTLADRISTQRGEYTTVSDEIDRYLAGSVEQANRLLDEIAALNQQIAEIEPGVGQANALRDQRDILIDELATHLDVSVVEQPSGAADVFVGSIPVILAGQSRGLELRKETVDETLEVSIRVASDGTTLNVQSGGIGGAMRQRTEATGEIIDDLDAFAAQLIFQVNRVHTQGQGRANAESITGAYGVSDTTANLNAAATKLPYRIENGSFFVHVTNADSGLRTTHRIDVDGNADSLDDLIAAINAAAPNVTAGTGLNDEIALEAANGYTISFSDDTSGALAALGVNTFFTGRGASDIAVHQTLVDDPNRLNAGAGHVAGSNGTALRIADLPGQRLDDLGGLSLREFWQKSVNTLAVRGDAANASVESNRLVRESLGAQLQAVSGVSIDEEAINLLTYQRQFQAAARFISVIDETLQTLISIV